MSLFYNPRNPNYYDSTVDWLDRRKGIFHPPMPIPTKPYLYKPNRDDQKLIEEILEKYHAAG